jgi:hypothetical protein
MRGSAAWMGRSDVLVSAEVAELLGAEKIEAVRGEIGYR